MPLVSVIIPTYNRFELLKKALTSVLNQSFKDFEVLIIDDCSQDETSQIPEHSADRRIRYIRNDRNKGISAVRNIGIRNSKGTYIAFLDDDDEWMPDKLEKQMNLIIPGPPNLGAVYTGSISIDIDKNKIVEAAMPQFRGNVLNNLIFRNFVVTSTIVLKKACFDRVGLFDESMKYAEDYDMWIRVAGEFEFDYIGEPLIKYFVHHNKISNNFSLVAEGFETVIRNHLDLFIACRKALSNRKLDIGVAYIYSGNTQLGRKALCEAIKLYPYDIKYYYNYFISLFGAEAYIKLKYTKNIYFPRKIEI